MNDTEIDLKALLSTLRRRWRMIAATFFVVVAVALIATFALTPKYTSSTQVYIDVNSKNLLSSETEQISSSTASSKIDSEVAIAKSRRVLLQVISDLGLVRDDEFGVKLGTRTKLLSWIGLSRAELPTGADATNQVLTKLENAVSVKRIGLTFLIQISATSQSPEKAAKIANAVANAYIKTQVSTKVENALKAKDILQARLTSASKALSTAEQNFDDYISDHVSEIAKDTGRADIALLQDQLKKAVAESNQTSGVLDEVQSSLNAKDWDNLASAVQDDALAELARQRDDLVAQMRSKPSNSQAQIDLQSELDSLNAQISDYSQNKVKSLREEVAANQADVSQIKQKLRNSVLSGDLPSSTLTEIYGLQQDAEIARSQYQNLLARVRDLDAQSEVQVADGRIISEALPSTRPSFPNNRLILAMAGLVGLGLGVGQAFLWENFLGGFTTEEQVEGILHLDVAAQIPLQPLTLKNIDKSEVLSPADFMHLAPMSGYAESMRRIRANIDIALNRVSMQNPDKTNRGRTILVTSAVPQEGKSSTALALARAYALAGNKTLIIDCDLRKPAIHRYMGIDPRGDLAKTVKDSEDANGLLSVVGRDRHSSLSAIVSNRSSNTPTDQIVSSPTLSRLLDRARSVFDVIIIDSPPLVPVVDGIYLSRYADAVALVIQWGGTAQTVVKKAVHSLSLGVGPDVPVLTILNKQQGNTGKYPNEYGYYLENE